MSASISPVPEDTWVIGQLLRIPFASMSAVFNVCLRKILSFNTVFSVHLTSVSHTPLKCGALGV